MKIKEPRSPHPQGQQRSVKERSPSGYLGKEFSHVPGLDAGYERFNCDAPKPNTSSKKKAA